MDPETIINSLSDASPGSHVSFLLQAQVFQRNANVAERLRSWSTSSKVRHSVENLRKFTPGKKPLTAKSSNIQTSNFEVRVEKFGKSSKRLKWLESIFACCRSIRWRQLYLVTCRCWTCQETISPCSTSPMWATLRCGWKQSFPHAQNTLTILHWKHMLPYAPCLRICYTMVEADMAEARGESFRVIHKSATHPHIHTHFDRHMTAALRGQADPWHHRGIALISES